MKPLKITEHTEQLNDSLSQEVGIHHIGTTTHITTHTNVSYHLDTHIPERCNISLVCIDGNVS